MNESIFAPRTGKRRRRVGLSAAFAGLLLFALGAEPSLFGLDRSPVIGFVQLSVLLIGLGIICLGGYISLSSLWDGNGRSIPADIGQRLVATGYVIAVAAGMADIFGFGSQRWPDIPKFGYWQAIGVLVGEVTIGIGLLLLIPLNNKKGKPESDLDNPISA
ncbi:MAG: hypothetical protein ACOYYS_01030 [Chloroflexota bacterium]